MRDIHHALIATAVIALSALTASTAIAQYGPYGPYRYYRGPYAGAYYVYGADRANPSLSPTLGGWDLDNPRDFQLQGR